MLPSSGSLPWKGPNLISTSVSPDGGGFGILKLSQSIVGGLFGGGPEIDHNPFKI